METLLDWASLEARCYMILGEHGLKHWPDWPESADWRWRVSDDQHDVAREETVRSGLVLRHGVVRRLFGYRVRVDRSLPSGTLILEATGGA